MAEKKFVSKDNLQRVWTRLFGKVLNSVEEIEANTSENMIAGADAVKELNSSLGGLSFAQDDDGNWGYKVGADAVVPFKRQFVEMSSCSMDNLTIGQQYVVVVVRNVYGSQHNVAGATVIWKSSVNMTMVFIIQATSTKIRVASWGVDDATAAYTWLFKGEST